MINKLGKGHQMMVYFSIWSEAFDRNTFYRFPVYGTGKTSPDSVPMFLMYQSNLNNLGSGSN